MYARKLVALALAGALSLGVASATWLGEFGDVVLTAVAESVDPCLASETKFYTGDLESLVEVNLVELVLSDIDFIGLSVAGDCHGTLTPVVVVIEDPLLGDPTIASRSLLPQLSEDLTEDPEVLLSVDASDPLHDITALLTEPEARVAFCPAGVASCQP